MSSTIPPTYSISYDPNTGTGTVTGTVTHTGAGGGGGVGVAGVAGGGFVYTAAGAHITGNYTAAPPNHSHQTYTINTTGTYVDFNSMQSRIDGLEAILKRLDEEREMRKKYPALDNVYEQYEVMLEICKSKEADDAAGENSK